MREPPFFIVGCPRSGTTLLTDLLRSHPRLAIPEESYFIPQFFIGYGDPRNGSEAVALARRILSLTRVGRWHLSIAPEAFAPDRSFAAVVERLYGAMARQHGRERWGDKTPHYVEAIPTLLAIFPDARIIHVIRDGRDVAASWVAAGIEPSNLYTAARLWRRMVRAGRAAGSALSPDTYVEVRYESLLREPRRVMAGLCSFLGEAMCEAVLTPAPGVVLTWSRRVGRGQTVVRRRAHIESDNLDKWRAMPRRQRAVIESVAGDLLAELGYETEGLARPLSAAETLAWRLHHRVMWPIERLNGADGHRLLVDFVRTRWAALRGAAPLSGPGGRRRGRRSRGSPR